MGALPVTIDQLVEAFVRLHELERRSPGGGAWPFAGDGPWHLIQAEAGDYAGAGVDGVSREAAPRTPLNVAEVGERERTLRWLALVAPGEAGTVLRKAVWLGTRQVHRGEGAVPWTALARWIGWGRTPEALALAWRRELAKALCRMHGVPVRHWKQVLAREGV